ncbi:hypothetical protein GCM10023080_070120 [Streptomyces pseudoechinosporeus]
MRKRKSAACARRRARRIGLCSGQFGDLAWAVSTGWNLVSRRMPECSDWNAGPTRAQYAWEFLRTLSP